MLFEYEYDMHTCTLFACSDSEYKIVGYVIFSSEIVAPDEYTVCSGAPSVEWDQWHFSYAYFYSVQDIVVSTILSNVIGYEKLLQTTHIVFTG